MFKWLKNHFIKTITNNRGEFDWMWGTTGLRDMFLGKTSTFDPMSMYTPQQKASLDALMSLASTGSGGGITLGEAYEGSLGNFQQSQTSSDALAQLQNLLGGPEISGARSTFQDLADTSFDPSDPKSGYAEFSRQLARSGKESEDVLNREAAISGSRFGTGIGRRKVDLAERMQDIRGGKLADIYQRGRQQQLAGAQGLQGLAGLQGNMLSNLFNKGDFQRQLDTQKAQAEYGEFGRQREEELRRIGLMNNQMLNPLGPIEKKGAGLFGQLFGQGSGGQGGENMAGLLKLIMSLFSGGA